MVSGADELVDGIARPLLHVQHRLQQNTQTQTGTPGRWDEYIRK